MCEYIKLSPISICFALFGSNLFRLASQVQIDDPNLKSQIYDYIKSCVVGDVLINHKYIGKYNIKNKSKKNIDKQIIII